jgi:hypothetical protein
MDIDIKTPDGGIVTNERNEKNPIIIYNKNLLDV